MLTEGLLGTRIRELRKKLGMTQEDLADKLYIQKSVISGYEHGQHMSDERLGKLARILSTTPNYLLGFEEHTNPLVDMALSCLEEIHDERLLKMALIQLEAIKKMDLALQEEKTSCICEKRKHNGNGY